MIFEKTSAAVVAIINLILFLLSSDHPLYYQTTTAIIGKMYSNTMMVALNSRINISNRESGSADDSTKSSTKYNLEIRRSHDASHGDTVTLEQWRVASPEAHKLHVSMAIQSSSHWYWYRG